MVSVLPSHPANICRLALSAVSRVQMDIHGESTWATHGTHRVPGRPQRSSRHGALAPKTQPVSVHEEGRYILWLDVKQCARNGSHVYQGNVKKTPCQSAYAHRHCPCEELPLPGPRLCSRAPRSRNALLLVLATCCLHTEPLCQGFLPSPFPGLAPWQAPRMGLHDLLSVKIPASRIQGLASHPLGPVPTCPGQPLPLTV